MSFSAPYSQTPSAYVSPWLWETKFHNHTKHMQNYSSVYFNVYIFCDRKLQDSRFSTFDTSHSLTDILWTHPNVNSVFKLYVYIISCCIAVHYPKPRVHYFSVFLLLLFNKTSYMWWGKLTHFITYCRTDTKFVRHFFYDPSKLFAAIVSPWWRADSKPLRLLKSRWNGLVAKSVTEIYPLGSVFSGPRQTEIAVPAVNAAIGL